MVKKLIFLDADGTLASPGGKASPKVQEAIRQVQRKGHEVFLCTGRNYAGARPLLPIGFDGIIYSAGAYIEVHKQKIFEISLSDEDIQKAREVFDQHHVLYNLETPYITFQDKEMDYELLKHRLKNREKLNSELQRLINEQNELFNIQPLKEYDKNPIPVQKICFMCESENQLEEPKRVLSDKFNFAIYGRLDQDVINGEIILKGSDKGTAVQKVCEYLNVSIENTIAFGDSMNDYAMIQACGRGVVMGNGSEELKQYGDAICESVQDDGIYHELHRLGLF